MTAEQPTTHAFVTRGGIYMVAENRWSKVTALRDGRVLAGWGDMQGLMTLRRANLDEPTWVECGPEDIGLGDCAHFVSRDFWAYCTPVQAVITGSRPERAPEDITGRDLLVFTSSAAFRVRDNVIERLLDNGRRELATADDVAPYLRGALAFDVASDVRS